MLFIKQNFPFRVKPDYANKIATWFEKSAVAAVTDRRYRLALRPPEKSGN
jgi:hypothetical protein